MHKITTTIRPDETHEVDDRELADLKALGILKTVDGTSVPRKEQAATVAADEQKKEQ